MRDPAHLARLSCRVHDCVFLFTIRTNGTRKYMNSSFVCLRGANCVDCVHTGSQAKYSHGIGHVEFSVGQFNF